MVILERNWRCAHGEVDLIARDGETVVFVEVKTRTSTAFGHPLEAITPAKLARLRRLAGEWCRARAAERASSVAIRIDALSVLAPHDAPATVDHVAGVA